jgi:PAS domain S-box-containing protein
MTTWPEDPMTTPPAQPTSHDDLAPEPTTPRSWRPRSLTTALDATVLPGLIGYDQSALDASGVSLVIVDALAHDQPVVWVSPGFLELTGYRLEDVLGRNCRFLQTGTTNAAATTRMRQALAAGEAVQETLLNRRADGSVFWNELMIGPVRARAGQVTHFVGYQADVSARVKARAAHDRFLEAEQRAWAKGQPRD